MARQLLSFAVGLSLLGAPLLTGCDQEKATKTEEHTNPDGSKSSQKSEIKVDSNGNQKSVNTSEVKTPDGTKIIDKTISTTNPSGVTTESKTEHEVK